MKNNINVFFFIEEDMLKSDSAGITGAELKKLIEERLGELVSLNVCRCRSAEDFGTSLEKNLRKNAEKGNKAVYVLWGGSPDVLLSDRDDIKAMMENGRKEMGWKFVFMGNDAVCRKLSQKTGLTELTNIRHSRDRYGVRGALRCCAYIVGQMNANPA